MDVDKLSANLASQAVQWDPGRPPQFTSASEPEAVATGRSTPLERNNNAESVR
jgi:hypothetical protein